MLLVCIRKGMRNLRCFTAPVKDLDRKRADSGEPTPNQHVYTAKAGARHEIWISKASSMCEKVRFTPAQFANARWRLVFNNGDNCAFEPQYSQVVSAGIAHDDCPWHGCSACGRKALFHQGRSLRSWCERTNVQV